MNCVLNLVYKPNLMSFDHDYSVSKKVLNYHLILYKIDSLVDSNIETFLDNNTINNFAIQTVYIYKKPSYEYDNPNIIQNINYQTNDPNIKLYLIKSFLEKSKNAIILDGGYGLDTKLPTDKIVIDSLFSPHLLMVPFIKKHIIDDMISMLDTKKFPEIIKFIYENYKDDFHITDIPFANDKTIVEKYLNSTGEIIKPINVPKTMLYYPYFDLPLNNSSMKCGIFNTNGTNYQTKLPYPMLYKRFNNANQGIYIMPPEKTKIIPQIIHHIWETTPNNSTILKWKKIIHKPWVYKLWTMEDIKLEFDDENPMINILQKYGGIAINQSVIPVRLFDNEILSSPIIASYIEESVGTDININILGMIPGLITIHGKSNHIDVARKPFVGQNNYFVNIKEKEKDVVIKPTDEYIVSIYQKLFEGDYSSILSHPDITIYPSDYMKKYVYVEIPSTDIVLPKTPLIRDYVVTPQSMIASLSVDPLSNYMKNK